MPKIGKGSGGFDEKSLSSGKQKSSGSSILTEMNSLLSKKVDNLVWKNSGKKLIGLTLKELMEKCSVKDESKMAEVLARLGKRVKRTKCGTYFHMSRRISKKRRAELFY